MVQAEKRKAVFIDKDGTLIPDVPYNVDPALITLQSGVIEGLQLLKDKGFIFVMISNQSGVARGYFKIEELKKVEQKIDDLLKPFNIQFAAYYFCPHHPDGTVAEFATECNCRKPKSGMILQACEHLNIDASNSWMIGDILNDVEAGNTAGCKTILIDNGGETEWIMREERKPYFTVTNFLQAAQVICNNPIETTFINDNRVAEL